MRIIDQIKLYFKRKRVLRDLADGFINDEKTKELGITLDMDNTLPLPKDNTIGSYIEELLEEVDRYVPQPEITERQMKMDLINRRLGVTDDATRTTE